MKEKRLDFELLRLLAIFGVVFNHTQYRGFELYMLDSVSRVNYYGSLLLGVLCKMAVPLFFLVSGGLLLHRRETLGATLRRAGRIFLALGLSSAALYLCWVRWGYVPRPGVGDFLRRVWTVGVSQPYWYLYTYLGLMLMLPLLRPLAQTLSDRAYLYLMALHLGVFGLCATIGTIFRLGPLNPSLTLPLAQPEVFYFLLGYFLAHRVPAETITWKRLGRMWLVSAVVILGMLGMADLRFRQDGTSGVGYGNGWMLIPILTVYGTAFRLFQEKPAPKALRKVLETLGGCVFGTYLLEGFLRHETDGLYLALEPRIHVLPACLVWVAAVVLLGLGITWVLKKIPLLRRVL